MMELLKSLFRFRKQWAGFWCLFLVIAMMIIISPHIALGLNQSNTKSEFHKKKEQVKSALRKSVTCRADYNQDMSLCLKRAQGLGVDAVVVAIMIFQKSSTSSEVYIDKQKTLGETYITQFINEAHKNNIVVIMKPLLLIEEGINTIQRDTIKPKDRNLWYSSYKDVITTIMQWGRNSDGIVVGTELTSMQQDTEKWRDIIFSLRKQYPDMFFSYDVNWNALDKSMHWWEQVDAIGMSAYFPLCMSEKKPSEAELITCWNSGTKERILAYGAKYKRPIWFTEIGLTAREGSNTMPWGTPKTKWCPECQANWFSAAMKVWDKTPGFLGLTWWSLIGHTCITKVPNNAFSYFEEPTQLVLLEFYKKKPQTTNKQDGC